MAHIPLSSLVGKTIRVRQDGGCPWRLYHARWPDPADPENVLCVSEFDDFGEPKKETHSLRLGWGGRRDVDLVVVDLAGR